MKALNPKKNAGNFLKNKAIGRNPSGKPSNSHQDRHHHHSNLCYVYFRFSFFFLCSPFRFHKDKNGNFQIYRWFPQRILCAIANLLAIFKSATSLRRTFDGMKLGEDGPLEYLQLFSRGGGIMYVLAYYKGFWFNNEAYMKLIQFLDKNPLLLPSRIRWVHTTTFATLLCSFVSGFTICNSFALLRKTNWSPELWFRKLLDESRYTFFVEAKPSSSSTDLYPFTFLNLCLALTEFFSSQFLSFAAYFGDLCLLMHVLTLYIPLSSFTSIIYTQIITSIRSDGEVSGREEEANMNMFLIHQDLKHCIKQDADDKIERFQSLKTLSELIGNTVGVMIFPFLVEASFYYSRSFHDMLITNDIWKRLRLMFYFAMASIIIILSAEIVRKIRWFRYWLGERRRTELIDTNLFASLLQDLKLNKVGISAAGMFITDYNLIGTVACLSVTFFIVRLQSPDWIQS